MKVQYGLAVLGSILIALGFIAPAWATGPLVDNSINASAAASAAATGGNVGNISNNGGTHIQTNTQLNNQTSINTNTQGQQQGQAQHQGQLQGQGQGQKQQANNAGNHQDVTIDVPHQAPSFAAPSLTAAGTGVCLGSVSFGAGAIMASATVGFTKVDAGCEQRSAAALLYQMGYKDAAVRLLMKNDDVKEALGTDAPKAATASVVVTPTIARGEGSTPIHAALAPELAPATDIPSAMAATQARQVEAVQGN